jgi:hypothetical protein
MLPRSAPRFTCASRQHQACTVRSSPAQLLEIGDGCIGQREREHELVDGFETPQKAFT